MTCHHDHGRALTWGVASGKRCSVFCMRCRVVLLRYVPAHEALIFVREYAQEADQ